LTSELNAKKNLSKEHQLEVLREHRPPPNPSIIESLNDFFAMQISYAALIWVH